MLAIELVKNRETKEPAPELTKRITSRAAERGLIVLSSGVFSNVIRILVPMTASLELTDEGLGILEASITDAIS